MKYKSFSIVFVLSAATFAATLVASKAFATAPPLEAIPCIVEIEDPALPIDGEIEVEPTPEEPELPVLP